MTSRWSHHSQSWCKWRCWIWTSGQLLQFYWIWLQRRLLLNLQERFVDGPPCGHLSPQGFIMRLEVNESCWKTLSLSLEVKCLFFLRKWRCFLSATHTPPRPHATPPYLCGFHDNTVTNDVSRTETSVCVCDASLDQLCSKIVQWFNWFSDHESLTITQSNTLTTQQ